MANSGKKNLIRALFHVLLFCLSCAIIFAASSGYTKDFKGPWSIIIPVSISIAGTFALSFLFIKWENLKPGEIGIIVSNHSIIHFLTGVAIGSVLVTFQTILLLLISNHIKLIRATNFDNRSILISIVIYLLLACREEIAFRGYPLMTMNRIAGLWVSQIIIAMMFAAEHVVGGMQLWQAILGTGVGSFVFGMAAITTKGLAAPIGLHAAWNYGQWLYGFKDKTGLYNTIVEKGYNDSTEKLGMIIYILIMGITIAAFYYQYRRQQLLQVI